jgi:hypothetical protein
MVSSLSRDWLPVEYTPCRFYTRFNIPPSNLEIARRTLAAVRRKIEETSDLIAKARPELTELEELEQREMQVAKDLIEKMKGSG